MPARTKSFSRCKKQTRVKSKILSDASKARQLIDRRQLCILTQVLGLGAELGAVGDKRQEGSLDGSHRWGEGEVGSLGIFGALLEAVLKDAVDDATDAEGWLNDVRHELLLRGSLGLL